MMLMLMMRRRHVDMLAATQRHAMPCCYAATLLRCHYYFR